jgi:hypothetical protein
MEFTQTLEIPHLEYEHYPNFFWEVKLTIDPKQWTEITGHLLRMNRSKFKTSRKLSIVLEESMEYTHIN